MLYPVLPRSPIFWPCCTFWPRGHQVPFKVAIKGLVAAGVLQDHVIPVIRGEAHVTHRPGDGSEYRGHGPVQMSTPLWKHYTPGEGVRPGTEKKSLSFPGQDT